MTSTATQEGHHGRRDERPSRPTLSTRRKFVYASVVLLLVVVGTELVGRVLYADRTHAQRYLSQAYYQSRSWSRDLLETQDRIKLRYEPFVGWRRVDTASAYVNIVAGERRTVHPAPASPSDVHIWCFGGSTMWGTGVRDEHTIPSCLARLAHAAGLNVRVRNLGEQGWVMTQEALDLALKARLGQTPDIAVFHDGVNDVFSAFQSGRTDGAHQNLRIFEDYFKLGHDPRRRWWTSFAIYRAVRRIGLGLTGGLEPAVGTGSEADATAGRVAAMYLRNVDFVRRLGESYQFEVVCFWQPVVSCQPDYKTTESDACRHTRNPNMDGMLEFYGLTTAHVRGNGGVVDLSHVLGPSPVNGYFIDNNHLNEEGNAVIATAMFDRVRDMIELAGGRHRVLSNDTAGNGIPRTIGSRGH